MRTNGGINTLFSILRVPGQFPALFRARCEAGDKWGGYVFCSLGSNDQERRLSCVVSCLLHFCVIRLLRFKVSGQHPRETDMNCLLEAITLLDKIVKPMNVPNKSFIYRWHSLIRPATIYMAKSHGAVPAQFHKVCQPAHHGTVGVCTCKIISSMPC